MAERARGQPPRAALPRMRTYGGAVSAAGQFSWLFTREALLRLILSLVLAVALWTYVSAKQDPTIAWDYPQVLPVSTQGLAPGLTVSNNLGVVHLRIRINNRNTPVSTSSFHPYVNVTGLRAGLHSNLPIQVVSDPGISVVSVSPSHASVAIETLETRHVAVRWRMLGSPPAGYSAGHVNIDPNTITVSGPHSTVNQIADATVYLNLSQARYSIDGFYNPSPETSQGDTVAGASRVTLNPPQVHVTVPVQAINGYKSLPVLPVIKGQPEAGFGVSDMATQPSEITAYGSPGILGRLDTVKTAPISVAGRSGGTLVRHVRLAVPAGISTRTHWVSVTIQLGPMSASSSIQVGVTPRNLAPGLAVRTRPGSVLVTVLGPASALRRAAGKMNAAINLYGYGAGTYQLVPVVTAPKGIKIEGVRPSTVSVSVTGG